MDDARVARGTSARHAFEKHDYIEADQAEPERSVTDEARTALSEANTLHAQLDEIETRLFGPEPRAVSTGHMQGPGDAPRPPPVLAQDVRATRQRLDSANGRLSRILARL